jgi:multiple sugar transport system ATP-binding protein
MNRGVLQQIASPQKTYKRPANLFVADFIGSPTINFIPGKVFQESGGTCFKSQALILPASPLADLAGKKLIAAIRPEDIRVSTSEEKDSIPVEVYSVLPAGAEVILQVKKGTSIFNIRVMGEVSWDMGERVYLQFPFDSMIFYEKESGSLLYPREE